MQAPIQINVQTLDQVQQAPDPQFVIEPFLPRKGVAIIGGEPKAAKSLLAMQTVVDALQGKPVFKTMQANVKRVVVFNAEGGFWVLKRRALSYGALSRTQKQAVQVTDTVLKMTIGGRIIDQHVVNAIIHYWQGWSPDLVIFDPLVYYHNSDENDNAQMASVFEAFQRIAVGLNCGVLLCHHIRKRPQGDPMLAEAGAVDLRGASHIFGAVDGVATITKTRQHVRQVKIEGRHCDEQLLEARWVYPRFVWQ